MMDELKQCPFCGAPGAHYKTDADGYIYAGCDRECHGFPELIARWNTRPLEDALRARIAELEAAIKAAADAQEKWRQLWTAGLVDEAPEA